MTTCPSRKALVRGQNDCVSSGTTYPSVPLVRVLLKRPCHELRAPPVVVCTHAEREHQAELGADLRPLEVRQCTHGARRGIRNAQLAQRDRDRSEGVDGKKRHFPVELKLELGEAHHLALRRARVRDEHRGLLWHGARGDVCHGALPRVALPLVVLERGRRRLHARLREPAVVHAKEARVERGDLRLDEPVPEADLAALGADDKRLLALRLVGAEIRLVDQVRRPRGRRTRVRGLLRAERRVDVPRARRAEPAHARHVAVEGLCLGRCVALEYRERLPQRPRSKRRIRQARPYAKHALVAAPLLRARRGGRERGHDGRSTLCERIERNRRSERRARCRPFLHAEAHRKVRQERRSARAKRDVRGGPQRGARVRRGVQLRERRAPARAAHTHTRPVRIHLAVRDKIVTRPGHRPLRRPRAVRQRLHPAGHESVT